VPLAEDHLTELYLATHARLTAAGYEHYEISSYARPGKRAVHNALYWRGAAFLGLGVGAASLELCADGSGRRTTNPRRVSAYLHEHPLSKQVDIDKTIDWLKGDVPPDAATISEFEAAVVIARAMSKFAAAYTDAPPEWYDFLSWGVAKGHWPTLPSMT